MAPPPPEVDDELELEELLELDDELLELDEELLELEEELLELDELLLELELPEPLQPTGPPLPHWLEQVVMPIQLALFSHPHPEDWLEHIAYRVPYQLH